MKNYEIIKFKVPDENIDIDVLIHNRKAWLTIKDMSILFNVNSRTISRNIDNFLPNKNVKNSDFSNVTNLSLLELKGSKNLPPNSKFFDNDLIYEIGRKIDRNRATLFKQFVENLFSALKVEDQENCQIIIFDNGRVHIPLELSKNEQTIWSTEDQIAEVFGTTRQTINYHIKNILKDGELEANSVRKEILHTGPDGKQYSVAFYNLDMALSIGYRISTKIAIQFRKWATEVIKETIINGYYINEPKCLECKKDILELQNKINELILNQNKEIKYDPGDQMRSFIEVSHFLKTAEREILIIDNYFGKEFDEVLAQINVKKTIITNPKNEKIETNDNYTVIKSEYYHDRYVFVDDVCYLFGSSIKDIGKHQSTAIRLRDFKIKDVFEKIKI